MNDTEYDDGFKSAVREIDGDCLTPWAAQRYLDMVTPREGDRFDAGFTDAMRMHAAKA